MSRAVRSKVTTHYESGWDYGYRRSAFFHVSLANDASYTVYNNRLMPVTQGEDRIEGYWNLRKGAIFLDTGERPLEIRGKDAEKFCNNLFTKDISKLKPGRSCYGLMCYPNGGLLCDGVLMRLAEDRFWYVQADGEAFTWFMANTASYSDLEIVDPNSTVVQIQGPKSLEILERASDSGMPDPFGYFGVAEIYMGGQPVIVSRTGYTAELGFEIYTFDDDLDAHKLWDHLVAAGKPYDMAVIGLDSIDARRIEAGILNYGSDIDHTMNPFEAGLGPFINLDSDTFIGKDALVNASSKECLVFGLQSTQGEPATGSAIKNSTGETIGVVTASSWSPYLEKGVAIVRLKDVSHRQSQNLKAISEEGKEIDVTIHDFPFYDESKEIPRGKKVIEFD